MSRQFNRTGILRPGRSLFNLSYEKKLTCDMGMLIPVQCDEVVPGDIWKQGIQAILRMQPLVAPIMHEVNVYFHTFFGPSRLLDENFEDFISGGEDGEYNTPLVRWTPTNTAKYSLWDYLGFPVGVTPTGALPLNFPRAMYNRIFNEYYRDENLQAEVSENNEAILYRAWEKDYFTSALPWQQRGIAPALPISGITSAVWEAASFGIGSDQNISHTGNVFKTTASPATVLQDAFNNNTVDLSAATTFNVADLRLAFQIQKWLERNARAGSRYTEFLNSHFGVSPRDDRLQRMEYIGGAKFPVIVSEVLQTSETGTSPQGNLAGHGITAGSNFIGKFRVPEFGYIMTIMSIMPRSAYQQGIDRQWLRETKFDYYFPEFSNLSEQAILQAEIYATGVEAENQTIFGYQGRYDEMRVKRNMVVADMRDTFDYWHLGRQFGTAPVLNEDFIKCVPRKDIFAVPSEPGFVVSVGNIIRAARPMPIMSNPGLIDHN